MGFGIFTIGCLALLAIDWGGTALAGAILAYGLYLASRLDSRFKTGAVCALCMIPHGFVLLLEIVLDIDVNVTLKTITEVLMLLGWAGMMFMLFIGVRRIAIDNGVKKLANRCDRLMYFYGLYFACELGLKILPMPQMSVVLMIARYIFVIIGVLFAHYCFVHISTQEQTEKDIADVAAIEKKEVARKMAAEKKYNDAVSRRKKK